MKVQLHRRKSVPVPSLSKRKSLEAVATLYKLLPIGGSARSTLEISPHGLKFVVDPVVKSYACYGNSIEVAKDRLQVDFLKKFTGMAGEDPKGAALATFLAAEESCRLTNRRIRKLRNGANAPYLNSIMLMAQRKISRVLGSFSIDEMIDSSYWGPGVTSSVKGAFTDAVNKFQARPEASPQFAKSASQLLSACPSWSALLAGCDYGTWVSPLVHVIGGNSVVFVPKTAKTHRTIAVEPHLNAFFQLGIGKMIRRRLKRTAKIDLDDQTINQRLAQLGSSDGSLATIDLSSASDTISKELVRDLVGEDWFAWMDRTRSQCGIFPDKKLHVYEKFSSMGNGFTFDLESLLFWALASSVVEKCGFNPFWCNVMGDDIIVPSGCYLRVTRILQLCGFSVNLQKSFSSGPFRESCGKDYWNGLNVRPLYLKEIPSTPLHWLRIANGIRRLASQWLKDHGCSKSLKPAYDYAVSWIPKDFRYKIPDGFGDGGLIVNFDEAAPPIAGDGWEGFLFTQLSAVSEKMPFQDRSLVTSGVHRLSEKGNRISLRDRVYYKKTVVVAASWPDIGAWS